MGEKLDHPPRCGNRGPDRAHRMSQRAGLKRKILKKFQKALAFLNLLCYYTLALRNAVYAPVAQLDRVTDYESVGRGFESLPAYQRRIIRTLSQ